MQSQCPSRGVLHQYTMGDLLDSDAEMIAAHLEGCDECMDLMHELTNESDALISALKRGKKSNTHAWHEMSQGGDAFVGAELNGYRLLEEVGRGGMGQVFRAMHPRLDQEVALKVMKPGKSDPHMAVRFEAEQQTLALMNHPNIARVLDGGMTIAGRPFLVMELIQGVAIHKYCDRNRLDLEQRLELFVQVCLAVQHAHQKGIIHRDIKPSNVLVTEVDGKPVPKVIDFGVAKAMDQQRETETQVGMVVGTPEYMSPEQASPTSKDIDTRSDVYALGMVLYELLTGLTPFRMLNDRTPVLEIIRAIREDDPPSPSLRLGTLETVAEIAALRSTEPGRLVRHIRGELDWIVLKCLEKVPADRYPTATALADDIQRYLRNEPIAASPPSLLYRVRKFVRRNKVPVYSMATALLALFGGFIGTTIGMMKASQAQAVAEKERDEKNNALVLETKTRHLAIKSLRSLTSRIVTVQLAQKPELTEADKQYYHNVLDIYKVYLNIRGEDEESSSLLAEAYSETGKIRQVLGDYSEVIKMFENSLQLVELLMATNPSNRRYQMLKLTALTRMGNIYENWGKTDQAREHLNQAISIAKRLETQCQEFEEKVEIIQCHHVMAEHLEHHGQFAEAVEQHQASLRLLSNLSEADPQYHQLRQLKIQLLSSLGWVEYTLKHIQTAEKAFLEATSLLPKQNPDIVDPEYRHTEATLLYRSGTLFSSMKKWNEAESNLLAARHIMQRLVQEYPGFFRYKETQTVCLNQLGLYYLNTKKYSDAESHLQAALAVRQELIRHNDIPVFNINLGGIFCNLGKSQIELGKYEAALGNLSQAVEVLSQVRVVNSDYERCQIFLRNSYHERGLLMMRLNRWEESVHDWDQCLKLQPEIESIQMWRIQCLVQYKPEAAVKDMEIITRKTNFNSDYAAAGIYCLAGRQAVGEQQERYHALAVQHIRRLVPKKFFSRGSNWKDFQESALFSGLRQREDYKKVIKEIEASR